MIRTSGSERQGLLPDHAEGGRHVTTRRVPGSTGSVCGHSRDPTRRAPHVHVLGRLLPHRKGCRGCSWPAAPPAPESGLYRRDFGGPPTGAPALYRGTGLAHFPWSVRVERRLSGEPSSRRTAPTSAPTRSSRSASPHPVRANSRQLSEASVPGFQYSFGRKSRHPPWSSGVVEGHVKRIKMLKRQMFGQAGFRLLRKRVLLYS